MTDPLQNLADKYGLDSPNDDCPYGEACRYLYSREKVNGEWVYRYAFALWWGAQTLATTVAWVLFNPATGDTEKRHRPVLDYCRQRSREWRYGGNSYTGLVIVNLFAYRATNPKKLTRLSAEAAVGPHNDNVLEDITRGCGLTVAAWGNGNGSAIDRSRSADVRPILEDPHCLQKKVGGVWQDATKSGEPFHPARMAHAAKLIPLPSGPQR